MNPSYNSGGIYSSGVTPPATPSAPISSGTPVSSPSPKMQLGGSSRKPKKGIVIGAILIVVALALGIAAVIMLPKGGGSSNNATSNADFYKYANYLLYGNQNTNANLGEYDENADYAVVTAFDDGNTGYFDTLQNLWNGFYERIVKDENIAETSTLRGEVDWQNELMDFVGKYAKLEEWDEEHLVELYIEKGRDDAIKKIDENYADLLGTSFEQGADYVKALIAWSKAVVELYSRYDSLGCVKDDAIDDICVEDNKKSLDSFLTTYSDADNSLYINEVDMYDVLYMMSYNAFEILNSLGGGD